MQTSYDLGMMKAMDFCEAKPRSGPSARSDAEVTAIVEALRGLATRDEGIHTRDPFITSPPFFAAPEIPEQVKAMLNYVDRH